MHFKGKQYYNAAAASRPQCFGPMPSLSTIFISGLVVYTPPHACILCKGQRIRPFVDRLRVSGLVDRQGTTMLSFIFCITGDRRFVLTPRNESWPSFSSWRLRIFSYLSFLQATLHTPDDEAHVFPEPGLADMPMHSTSYLPGSLVLCISCTISRQYVDRYETSFGPKRVKVYV